MKKYYLANARQNANGIVLDQKAEITGLQAQEIESWFSFSTYFERCHSIRIMTRESGNDFLSFCKTLSSYKAYNMEEANNLHIRANKLLINYLSFLRVFYDVIANALSMQKGKEALERFHTYDSQLYDTYVSYRLLKFLRNYITHFDIPLSGLTFNSSGMLVYADVNALKRSDKWKKIEKDMALSTEQIDIRPHVTECQRIIDQLYLNAIEYVLQDAIDGNQKLTELYRKFGLYNPMIIYMDDNDPDAMSSSNLPQKAFSDYFEELNRYPKYNFKINYIKVTPEGNP